MKLLVSLFLISISLWAWDKDGVMNGGGGNSYQGKPLESYAVNPTGLHAYSQYISPLLLDIKNKEDGDNSFHMLGRLIHSVFRQKIWYFVPGPLEQIPAELLNSAVKTDQAMFQSFDHVWVDKNLWNKMPFEDQGRLLLHEVFMGLKILKFASPQRLCLAAYPGSDCSAKQKIDREVSLSARDYTDVQNLTISTFSNFVKMEFSDWVQSFSKYRITFDYDWFTSILNVPVTSAELGGLLKQSMISGFLPQYGFNMRRYDSNLSQPETPEEWLALEAKTKETCQVSATINQNVLNLKIKTETENFSARIPLPKDITSQQVNDFMGQTKPVKQIGIPYFTKKQNSAGGYPFYNISLGFDSYRLAVVYIQEMVCQDAECKKTSYIDVKNGMMLVCSDSPTLFPKAKN
ncbi:MAG: hypothetical protein JNL11_00190 [Bdellovibrionaceae bacterium]|nr:hypothetical protein [Pseudobdellovibrionaceae bacterium]